MSPHFNAFLLGENLHVCLAESVFLFDVFNVLIALLQRSFINTATSLLYQRETLILARHDLRIVLGSAFDLSADCWLLVLLHLLQFLFSWFFFTCVSRI